MVPHVAPGHPVALFRLHVTPFPPESFMMFEYTRQVPFTGTPAMQPGSVETVTEIAGRVMVIVAVADLVVSATDVAVKVTVGGFGTAKAGAT